MLDLDGGFVARGVVGAVVAIGTDPGVCVGIVGDGDGLGGRTGDELTDRCAGAATTDAALCDGHDGRVAATTLPTPRRRTPPASNRTISLGLFMRILTEGYRIVDPSPL